MKGGYSVLQIGKSKKSGEAFTLPKDAVTQTFAVLAKRGCGKTYSASVVAEEMLKSHQQIVAIDPTGAWWGLRSIFPIVIFGGEHADVPLEEGAGEVVARAIVENGFSAVVDLSLFRKGQLIRFMTTFAETLYRLNRDAIHLFVDEADAVAPQAKNYGGDENRMLGAMEDIVRRGRKRGIGCTLITQRPAVLNKNVLTQCEILIALRLVHPKDIDAIEEWVNVHADPTQAKSMIDSLPSLATGTAWFWSPGWGDIFECVEIRQRETFDSGATPKAGERQQKPKKLAEVDLKVLGEQIAATIEKQKSEDPRELRKKVAELERQLKGQKPAIDTKSLALAEERGWNKARAEYSTQIVHLVNRLQSINKLAYKIVDESVYKSEKKDQVLAACGESGLDRLLSVNTGVLSPAPKLADERGICKGAIYVNSPTSKGSAQSDGGDRPTGGIKRMLTALACRPKGLTKEQLGVRAGLSSRSGTFGVYLGKMRSHGWVIGSNVIEITDAGLQALGDYVPLPKGRGLLEYWKNQLGNSGASRMLYALWENNGPMSKEDLGAAAGISSTSGTFGVYLGKLRRLELVEGRGNELKISSELND